MDKDNVETYCCEEAAEWDDAWDGIMRGHHHNGNCDNYDGAPWSPNGTNERDFAGYADNH